MKAVYVQQRLYLSRIGIHRGITLLILLSAKTACGLYALSYGTLHVTDDFTKSVLSICLERFVVEGLPSDEIYSERQHVRHLTCERSNNFTRPKQRSDTVAGPLLLIAKSQADDRVTMRTGIWISLSSKVFKVNLMKKNSGGILPHGTCFMF